MKKSLLLLFLDWIKPYLTENVVGWIYATNALISFSAAAFLWKMQEDGANLAFGCGFFFLVIAVAFWLPREWGE